MKKKKVKLYHKDSHTFAVCAYGESPYLEECICSLLAQTQKTGIFIATSTPNSHIMLLAEKYDLPVYVNTGEKGLAGDWNYAYRCAKTPLVTLAHQDDRYYKNYTEDVLAALNTCSHPLIVFTDYHEIREKKIVSSNRLLKVKRLMLSPLRIHFLWKSRWTRRRILAFGNAVSCPTVTLVKENLEDFSFQNNMKSNIDWQAWEEISRKKGEFAYIPKPCMGHRIHRESTTSGLLKVNGRREEDLQVLYRFWPKWMAKIIERFYQNAEQSNQLE